MPLCCPKGPSQAEIAIDDSPVVTKVLMDASELPDGAKKEVEVNGRKLLLVNEKGTIHCINGLCSHYNYPLINGIFMDGKVRCPLHGACFNLRTGDIEEYPGFDALNSYQVKKENGKLVLVSTEKKLSSDRRIRRPLKIKVKKEKPIVVVGGGPAADSLTEHLRLLGCTLPIVILTAEPYPPYDRVLLSKNMGVDIKNIRHRSDEFYAERNITVRTKTRVVGLHATERNVKLENGELLEYSTLVLATGGSVRKLSDPGANLKNIYYLREYTDIEGLLAAAEGKDVVVIGGSFIGMESAATLQKVAKSVTVICSTDEPMPAYGRDVGAAFRKYFETKGVSIRNKARVASIEGDSEGAVAEVRLVGGATLPAQIVVAGIGVAPNTGFLRHSPIRLDNRGFVLVDSEFRATDPHVYAIGDVAAFSLPYWDRQHINIQHFQTAQKQGELAAYSLMKKPHPGPLVPFFWSIFFFERGCRFIGLGDDYDEIFSRGDINNFDFRKYYIKDGTVVAVCESGPGKAAITFAEIFKRGIRVTRDEVEKNMDDKWNHYLQ